MLICLSCQRGIDAYSVADAVSAALKCDVISPAGLRTHISPLAAQDEHDYRAALAMWRAQLSHALIDRAELAPLLALDCGAEYVFTGAEALRVRLIAPFESRARRLAKRLDMPLEDARHWLESTDDHDGLSQFRIQGKRAGSEPRPDRFHLLLNYEVLDAPTVVETIAAAARHQALGGIDCTTALRIRERVQRRLGRTLSAANGNGSARFAHPSERMFARLLDFYRIPWQYEPRTFTLEHDHDGRITEAFTPDFYLPSQDLYIELTTMRQRLVTRKNRKMRRLNELFPEVRIRILYQRDLEDLAFRLGVEGGSVLVK